MCETELKYSGRWKYNRPLYFKKIATKRWFTVRFCKYPSYWMNYLSFLGAYKPRELQHNTRYHPQPEWQSKDGGLLNAKGHSCGRTGLVWDQTLDLDLNLIANMPLILLLLLLAFGFISKTIDKTIDKGPITFWHISNHTEWSNNTNTRLKTLNTIGNCQRPESSHLVYLNIWVK